VSPTQVVLSTSNPGKIKEIQQIAAGLPIGFVPSSDLGAGHIEETGATYLENALLKARAASVSASMPAISDDSGLEVDFLDGAPGVRSARFASPTATDDENNVRLASLMFGVPRDRRTARYRCVAVFVDAANGVEIYADGACEGRIATDPAGDGGFGYDPWFIPEGYEQTKAVLGADEKD
jgi:XTP/dITP diphosphohydrolase